METITYVKKEWKIQKKVVSSRWKHVLLLSILFYEGVGCLLGGTLLVLAPDGRLMNMPVHIMNNAFPDFLIPGMLLLGLGILNTLAFISVLRKSSYAWLMTGLALGGLIIWFWIEIAILQQLHWLHAMWGLPVVAGILVAIAVFATEEARRNGFLLCGLFASLLYIGINVIVAMSWEAYHPMSQTVSELSAIGAPTRNLWLVLSAAYTLLMLAFAWGVLKSAHENRRLRVVGGLLLAYAVLGILWPFAPMHLRENLAAGQATFSDTLHIALGVITELIFLLAMGFAAVALGKQFRLYSIVTFMILLAFGILTFLDAPAVAKNQPTPFIGVWERINIGNFLLWIMVLSFVLLRKENHVRTIPVH